MKKNIGLAGKSGSGKNVIADMLCANHGYHQIAVADAIRNEASSFIIDSFEFFAYRLAFPDSFELVALAFKEAIWAKPTPPEVRVLLQWWGTEYRRAQNHNYWIDRLSDRLKKLGDQIVISDVRLPDEMATIREHGGEVWLVERDGIENVGIAGHLTEHALEGVEFDRVISNNGTLLDLEVKLASIISI